MKSGSFTAATAVMLACVASGCASIFTGGGSQKVGVTSAPAGAQVSITNRAGQVVSTGVTPFEVKLKKGAGYFRSENYTLNFSLAGYQPQQAKLTPRISGWYFGNILIGGLIGMVGVDPATGAMYKLEPKDVEVTLKALNVTQLPEEGTVVVVATTQLPPEVLKRMTRMERN
ncbi:MAG TPA: hypothetical protein VMF52_13585 [Steroidobacteraceae bacterium]|nr:hypothetical protein [Steroidobacteraceae bacterium]